MNHNNDLHRHAPAAARRRSRAVCAQATGRRTLSRSSVEVLIRAGMPLLVASLLGAVALATPVAAETIKIGAPIPITGPYSSDGTVMEKGLQLAVDELNGQGGLLGRQIEVIVFDIGDLTPDKLQAAATNLIERESVDALINGYGGMGPDIPAFCPYPLPYIHNDATSNVIELRDQMNCGNIFMGSDLDVNYGRITFRQLAQIGHAYANKNLALIHGPYDWELNVAKGAREVAEEMGWTVVVDEEVPYETKQWGGILSKVREASPALIYFELLDPAGVKTFVDQFQENPARQSLLYAGYTVSVPAFGEIVSAGGAEGVLGMTLTAQRPNAQGEEFTRKWKEKFNEEPPFSIAAQIYDEVMLWAAAVKKVGSVRDFAAVNEALRNTVYQGVSGTFKFNSQQYVVASDETLPVHLLQVQDSRVVQLVVGSEKYKDFRTPSWFK